MAADWSKICETQHGIIQFVEEAARILAHAGIASHKAVGDSPTYAVSKWSAIMRDRALELVREMQREQQSQAKINGSKARALPAPKVIEGN